MTTLENFQDGTTLFLVDASPAFSGYGHKKIFVELEYKGQRKEFIKTTDNMPDCDDAEDIEDVDEKSEAYYRIVEYKIKDAVEEWMAEIDAENAE